MAGSVEAVLRLTDLASPALAKVETQAKEAEKAVEGIGTAAKGSGEQAKRAARSWDDLAESAEGVGESARGIAEGVAAIVGATVAAAAAFGALADQAHSAVLEVRALALQTGLSAAQVQALQRAAYASGLEFDDLAAAVEVLGDDGARAIETLDGRVKRLATTVDQDAVRAAERWRASLAQIQELGGDALESIRGLSQSVLDGVLSASVLVARVVSDIAAQIGELGSALYHITTVAVTGDVSGLAESLGNALVNPFASVSGGIADARAVSAALGADRDARVREADAAAQIVAGAKAKEEADKKLEEYERAKDEEKRQTEDETRARKERAAAEAKRAQDAAAAQTALLGQWVGWAADIELARAAAADLAASNAEAQVALANAQAQAASQAARSAASQAAANLGAQNAERGALDAAARGRTLAGVQAGIGVAGQVASGDLAGLAGLAGGPAGAIAAASVGLLQQIGDMGADKIVAQIRDSALSVAAGIEEIPDLLVGLVEALPEIFLAFARAILVNLPKAIGEAVADALRGLFDRDRAERDRADARARNPRGIVEDDPFGASRDRRLLIGGSRDRRAPAARAAASARARQEVLIVRESLESRRLNARRGGEDARIWREDG